MPRAPIQELHRLRQLSLSPEVNQFMDDAIKTGQRSAWVEELIRASPEFAAWKGNH